MVVSVVSVVYRLSINWCWSRTTVVSVVGIPRNEPVGILVNQAGKPHCFFNVTSRAAAKVSYLAARLNDAGHVGIQSAGCFLEGALAGSVRCDNQVTSQAGSLL